MGFFENIKQGVKRLWQKDVESVFHADRFDLEDFEKVRNVIPGLERDEKEATEQYGGSPVQDSFFSLYKANPRMKQEAGKLAPLSKLIQKGMETPEWQKLRENTVGASVGAAVGAQHFTRNIMANLPDEVKESAKEATQAQAQADQAQETLENLLNALETLEGTGQGESDLAQQLSDKITETESAQAQAQAQAQAAMENFEQTFEENEAQVTAALNRAAGEAEGEAEAANVLVKSFGLAAGDPNGTASAEVARAAMQAIKQNPNLAHLAEMLGWAKRSVKGIWREAPKGNKNFTGYKASENLNPSRLASSEMLAMGSKSPFLKAQFGMKLANGELLHKHYDGEEQQGKGDMVIVRDESGSMHGRDHSLAVALEWALLDVCQRDDRKFYSIPFAGTGQYHVWEAPTSPDPNGLLNHLTHFYGGGTDPYPPLNAALDLIEDNGELKADVLVITDGAFGSPTQEFLAKIARKNVKIVTLTIGSWGYDEANKFSDKVINITDMLNDKKKLLQALRELV